MLRVRVPAAVLEYQPFAALADGARRDGRGALPQSGGQEAGARAPWLVQRSHQPPDFLGCRGRRHAMGDPSPADTKVHTFG